MMRLNVQSTQGECLNVREVAGKLRVAEGTVSYFIEWGVPKYLNWEEANAEKKAKSYKLHASQIYINGKEEFKIRRYDLDVFSKQLRKVFKERKDSQVNTIYNRFRWWQSMTKFVKKHLLITITLCVVGFFLILFAFMGYSQHVEWTGVVSSGTEIISPKRGTFLVKYPADKTLWDWLGLLFVPLLLGATGYWFANVYTEGNVQTDHDAALDKERAEALQAYLDKMSQLLLKGLSSKPTTSGPNSAMERAIAQTRTWIVLRQLDRIREGDVIRFLHGATLISRSGNIIDLRGAQLEGAALRWADLHDANLQGAWMTNAELSQAQLDDTNLSSVHLSQANLRKASLSHANLSRAGLIGANFCGTNLSDANLKDTILYRADLSHTNLSGADLSGADLSGADLSGANFSGANLSRANLSETKITDKQLKQAKSRESIRLNAVNLRSAQLEQVEFYDAGLNNTDLSHADLHGAHLEKTHLNHTKFTKADLSGANLSQATGITEDELKKQAKSLKGTTMPDGTIHQ